MGCGYTGRIGGGGCPTWRERKMENGTVEHKVDGLLRRVEACSVKWRGLCRKSTAHPNAAQRRPTTLTLLCFLEACTVFGEIASPYPRL